MSQPKLGYYQKKNVLLNILAGAPNSQSVFDIPFPFKMLAWKATVIRNARTAGDSLTMTLRPNNIIGALDSSPSGGTSSFVVDSAASLSVWPGTYLQFNDLTNEIIQIKTTSGVLVTTVTPLVNSHANLTPLGLHIRLVDNYTLTGFQNLELGEKGSNGLPIDADDVIRISYTNVLGMSKDLIIDLDAYTGAGGS